MTGANALFELQHPGPTPVCWSYGMGAESTAGVVRTLLDPDVRPPELHENLTNLILMTAQTGDEWSPTADLVEQYVLPLLREHRVRLVEVARAGPSEHDGIAVLQDTRAPYRLHADADEHGFFALSEEHRRNGVLPQLGGSRKCSAKAKGFPLDTWRARELGARPYVHAVGFNVEEGGRIATDTAVTLGGQRQAIYPVHEWGWTRGDCVDYLYRQFGVVWPKSCCRQCPFAGCRRGWPEQLARFQALPDEAAHHLVDEYVTVALNSNSGLFGPGKTLTSRLERAGATGVLAAAADILDQVPWALYRLRRIYHGPATAWRAVEAVARGDRTEMQSLLPRLGACLGQTLRSDGEHHRLWLAERTENNHSFPALEEFYVAAPDQVQDKQRPGFEARWTGHAPESLLTHEDTAANAIEQLRRAHGSHLRLTH